MAAEPPTSPRPDETIMRPEQISTPPPGNVARRRKKAGGGSNGGASIKGAAVSSSARPPADDAALDDSGDGDGRHSQKKGIDPDHLYTSPVRIAALARGLVDTHPGNQFRSNVEFYEKPRQLMVLGAMMGIMMWFAYAYKAASQVCVCVCRVCDCVCVDHVYVCRCYICMLHVCVEGGRGEGLCVCV